MYSANSQKMSNYAVWMLTTVVAALLAGTVAHAETLGETVTLPATSVVQSGVPITERAVSVEQPTEIASEQGYEVVTRKSNNTTIKEYRRNGQVEFVEVSSAGARPYYVNYSNDPLSDHNRKTGDREVRPSSWMLHRW